MSQLAPELLLMILKASDHETLMTWCDATLGNAFLHKAALHECWDELEINVEDLVPAPEELHEDPRLVHVQRYKHNLESKSKLSQAIKYALHIRSLDFNLSVDHLPKEHIPTFETSIHTARLLLPAATNLETLYIDGPACKEVCNSIKEIPKLRKLVLGRRKSRITLRDSKNISYRGHWPSERAGWVLPSLEEYENHQFWYSYAHHYLLTSQKLRRIYISVMQPYDNYEELEEEYYDTIRLRGPLNSFLTNWKNDTIDSPPKLLKSLSVVDHWFQGSNAMFVHPSPKGCPTLIPDICLEELYIHSSMLTQPADMLSQYPNARLRSLQLSAARGSPWNPDGQLADSFDSIQEFVGQQQESLQEIVLLDVWNAPQTLFHRLETHWAEYFSFTDLTLFLSPMDFHLDIVNRNSFLDRPLSHWLWGSSRAPTQWGTCLQRICLGDNAVSLATIDCLNDPSLSALRILILCPMLSQTKPKGSSYLDSFKALQMASSIVAKAPPSLRYLAIDDQVYWLSTGKLMNYKQAKLMHGALIQAWMTQDDLHFIGPLSRWNKTCQPVDWLSYGNPLQDQIAEQNFLVARRITNQV